MVKKIDGPHTAIQDRLKIYNFWVEKNKSDSYSKKLETLFNEAAKLISDFLIGTETDFPDLRVKIIRSYKLFYLNLADKIQILRVWDSRQNPASLEFQ